MDGESARLALPNSTPAESQAERRRFPMVLVRQEIGDVLRDFRLQKGRTLRQVASKASVALGYLSEVERGQKEASSEILASVAEALDTPISVIMHEVGDRIAVLEGMAVVPESVPDELVAEFDAGMMVR
jgi:transcriptional regulator with XRE-family HTH domain